MSAVDVAVGCAVAVFSALACALAPARSAHRHWLSLDDTWSGPQNLHRAPVPRIGGIAVAAGGFAVFYTLLYRRIVRFGVPAWLVVRARARAERAADGEVGEEANARQ